MTTLRMTMAALGALASVVPAPATAGPAQDASVAVARVLDKFNGGDIDAFFAAHAANAEISDEFAPYHWSGGNSVQRWAGDYDKDAKARGISEGRVDYSAPVRAESDGKSAYIVLPTTYRFKQQGRPMSAAGSMTFVMTLAGNEWKIASWTYSAAAPQPTP